MNTRARNTAIGSILLTMLSLGSYGTLAVYLVPLSQAFNVSIGQTTLIFTCSSIASLITALNFGRIIKRFKIKLLVPLAGVALMVMFLSFSFCKNIGLVYIGALFYGFSSVVGGMSLAQIEITWWFDKGRGKLISYLPLSTALFGLVVIPAIAQWINAYGVRVVALYQGWVTGGLIILIGLFLLSDRPEIYGLMPVGMAGQPSRETGFRPENNLNIKQIFTTPVFWLLILAVAIINLIFTGFINNASALYQSMGLDAVTAAMCISVYNIAKLAWSPFYGFLVDQYDVRLPTVVCGSIGAGILITASFLGGLAGALTIAALIGSISFASMLGPLSLPKVFGKKESDSLIGFSSAASSIGGMSGAPAAGFIFDATRSYDLFLTLAGFGVMAVVLITLACAGPKAIESVRSRQNPG